LKAEIIAVGTELLLGQIVNTNAQFLSRQCASLGIDVYFQTVVGDNADRLRQALEMAKGRADLVICTGGLGPTQDDLTKDVLAAFTGRRLEVDRQAMDQIEQLFRTRGLHMVESNARQALVLEGSSPFPNDNGLAVGVGLTDKGTHYMLLPGPPKEMKPMFETHGTQWLLSITGEQASLYSKMLKFAGIGESNLEHALIDLIHEQQDPTIAPYAKEGEVTIRLSTKARSSYEADGKLGETLREIRDRLGEYLYAEEDIAIEEAICKILRERKESVSFAESCTGGLLSDLMTAVPGSSEVFAGAIVSYTNRLKNSLLHVPMALLEGEGAPGAVSEQTAKAMAEGMLNSAETDIAVSVTGVAGPSPSEGKPVGLVYFGFARKGKETLVSSVKLSGNRDSIKQKAAKSAFYQLWRLLKS
jgi:nicotinamide-nucleotide amidase